MATRNPDGTIRAANKPAVLSQRMLIARWVEAEAFAQKILGVSYAKIAESMVRAVRGEIVPAVPLPAVQFPPDYRIHPRSVEKAFDRVIERQKGWAIVSTLKVSDWVAIPLTFEHLKRLSQRATTISTLEGEENQTRGDL